ncbi:hypothetical protein [Caulobacter hibisci]|uniref:Uncharacterized protein n=1 Tax=Caulobacter hibisci TaxID=2035993 RepID=A0ABS0SVX4_9CAUL|nr:hypothetical protein [Caulobacter hibisci]MBI1683753.1 hypothetical protein [Caulobacter hibisci]
MWHEIVVTEVTLYGPKLRCVAGFDRRLGRMVRPEPVAGGFWPAIVCGPNTTFHPGHVVRFRGETPDTAMPHRTEDVVVTGNPYRSGVLSAVEFKTVLARAADISVEAAFGPHLVFEGAKAYAPADSPCGSLACETALVERLGLSELVFGDERRLKLDIELRGHKLLLPVGAKDLKQAFQKEGLDDAKALLPERGLCQVRLGLARPFDAAPDRCYLQVNGIHAL